MTESVSPLASGWGRLSQLKIVCFVCFYLFIFCNRDRGNTWITGFKDKQHDLLRKERTETCQSEVHLPTTVSSMLSRRRATKTMNRISFLDCLSSRSHLIKWNWRSASSPPMLLSQSSTTTEKTGPPNRDRSAGRPSLWENSFSERTWKSSRNTEEDRKVKNSVCCK